MRKLQKLPAREAKEKKQEPLAESLQVAVPTGPRGNRLWRKMTDEQIVEYARRLMVEKGRTTKKELQEEDKGLYAILHIRKLISKIEFEGKQRSWMRMSDGEIVEYARKVVEENGITGRRELYKADIGLYNVLRKRRLLDEIEVIEKRRKGRQWKDMSDEEIVEYARKVVEENGITRRAELCKTDTGLYNALQKKGLLNEVGLGKKRRSWKSMSDEEIVDYAKGFVEEKGVMHRGELESIDSGLYETLRIRGLLDRVFAQLDQQKTDHARDAVIDALEAFAVNDNAVSEDDVA